MANRFRKLLRQRRLSIYLVTCLLMLCLLRLIPSTNDQLQETMRFSYMSIDVNAWLEQETSYCSGYYVTYSRRFFKMASTVYEPESDSFSIPCSYEYIVRNPRRHSYLGLYGEYAQARYTKRLKFYNPKHYPFQYGVATNTIVAIYREYPHNFFHAMTQWYNVFLLSKLLNFDPKSATILLLDRSPTVHIDQQWKQLYHRVIRSSDIHRLVFLGDVVFNIAGHESLMYYFGLQRLPYVEQFSQYFMNTFGVTNNKPLSCSNLTVTLVLRRDYYMYPGDKASLRNTERKILNEAEVLETLYDEFKGHDVETLIAESMDLEDQLKLTTRTDVLIAMHGCVLTHSLFLPPHAMVLEMFPIYWERKLFFSSIAKWRGIKHEVWQNDEERNEVRANCSTYVPPDVIRNYARRVKQQFMCT